MDVSRIVLEEEEEEEQQQYGAAAAAAVDPTQLLLAKLEKMEMKLNSFTSQGKFDSQPPPHRARVHVEGLSREVVAERIKNGVCIACGKPGHWKSVCTNPDARRQTNHRMQGK